MTLTKIFLLSSFANRFMIEKTSPFIGRHIQTGKNFQREILAGTTIDFLAKCVPYSLVFFCLFEIMQISHVLKMQMI